MTNNVIENFEHAHGDDAVFFFFFAFIQLFLHTFFDIWIINVIILMQFKYE